MAVLLTVEASYRDKKSAESDLAMIRFLLDRMIELTGQPWSLRVNVSDVAAAPTEPPEG